MVPLDIPPGRDPRWANVEIDWEAGTVLDVWGEAGPSHRVLLIHQVKLHVHWPKLQPPADPFDDPDGYEAQRYRRLRAIGEEYEAREATWQAAWDAERSKPIGQRDYFSAEEMAEALATDPRTLNKDMDLSGRIIEMISEWVTAQIFDLAAEEVAVLQGNPPEFAPLPPPSPGEILVNPGSLMLRRDAAERFIDAHNDIPNAVPLLWQWFKSAKARHPPQSDTFPAAADNDAVEKLGGSGQTPDVKRDIPYPVLRKHLEAIKTRGGGVPAQDKLVPEIACAFPKYRITRAAVRTVHEEVFGKLPPGKRSKEVG
jgi:hypothetical protein